MAEMVSPEQRAVFSGFRSKSEALASKVDSLPEKQRVPDWDHYRNKLAPSKKPLVDEMKKVMEAVKVTRPVNSMSAEIEKMKKDYATELEKFTSEGAARSSSLRSQASKYTSMKCLTQMTDDEVHQAFPEVSPEAYAEEEAIKAAGEVHEEAEEEEFDIQIPKFREIFPKK